MKYPTLIIFCRSIFGLDQLRRAERGSPQVTFSIAASKPSIVGSFASTAGSSLSARMALLLSGPIEAILSRGNFFTSFVKPNRA
jgi:hypothetical protein